MAASSALSQLQGAGGCSFLNVHCDWLPHCPGPSVSGSRCASWSAKSGFFPGCWCPAWSPPARRPPGSRTWSSLPSSHGGPGLERDSPFVGVKLPLLFWLLSVRASTSSGILGGLGALETAAPSAAGEVDPLDTNRRITLARQDWPSRQIVALQLVVYSVPEGVV